MTVQRVIAAVTWDTCSAVEGRPHLDEVTLFEGSAAKCDKLMAQPALWVVRPFICQFCASPARLAPTAIMILDVAEGPDE